MTVVWGKNAEKELGKMTKKSREQVKKGMLKIAQMNNPRQVGKALVGNLKGLWRYRIGDYRVICQIRDKELVILVVAVGDRKNVYK